MSQSSLLVGPDAPSSSAQALAPVASADRQALKWRLDDLDDDDLVAVGRVMLLRTPARIRKNVAVVVGVGVSLALFSVSPLGAAALLIGIGGYQLLSARGDIRSDLEDIGLSAELAASLAAACNLRSTERRFRWDRLLRFEDEADFREIGTNLVEKARKQLVEPMREQEEP
ncbi:MAG: hypothetical protein Q8O67_22965 [Deltaproteobacteria bacterium]|nr:hypothetical protein [Deltaproteobacteria bacterium]